MPLNAIKMPVLDLPEVAKQVQLSKENENRICIYKQMHESAPRCGRDIGSISSEVLKALLGADNHEI